MNLAAFVVYGLRPKDLGKIEPKEKLNEGESVLAAIIYIIAFSIMSSWLLAILFRYIKTKIALTTELELSGQTEEGRSERHPFLRIWFR